MMRRIAMPASESVINKWLVSQNHWVSSLFDLEGIWQLLPLSYCQTPVALPVNRSRVKRVYHQSCFLWSRYSQKVIFVSVVTGYHMGLDIRACTDLHGKELLKLSVHDFNCLCSAISDSLKQLTSFCDWDLRLLLLLQSQALEDCIEVMLDLLVDLRHNIFLFFPN